MSYTIAHLALSDRAAPAYLAPLLALADGSVWSIQAGQDYACFPKLSCFHAYDSVEVSVVNGGRPETWETWRRGDLYAWLPIELIDEEIERRGGLQNAR